MTGWSLLLLLSAPPPAAADPGGEPAVELLASRGDFEPPGGLGSPDELVLRLLVDDPSGRLREPVLDCGDRSARLLDDGSLPGDEAGDGRYAGFLALPRTPRLSCSLRDGDEELGALRLLLPSASRATARLLVHEGEPALSAPASETPGASDAGEGESAAPDASTTALLWLDLLAFLLLFGWLRAALRRLHGELLPRLERIESRLAELAGRDDPPRTGSSP